MSLLSGILFVFTPHTFQASPRPLDHYTCRWPLALPNSCSLPVLFTVYSKVYNTAVIVTVKARVGARVATLLLNTCVLSVIRVIRVLILLLCCCDRDHEGEGGEGAGATISRRRPRRARHDSLPRHVREQLLESLGYCWPKALPAIRGLRVRATRVGGCVRVRRARTHRIRGMYVLTYGVLFLAFKNRPRWSLQ